MFTVRTVRVELLTVRTVRFLFLICESVAARIHNSIVHLLMWLLVPSCALVVLSLC